MNRQTISKSIVIASVLALGSSLLISSSVSATGLQKLADFDGINGISPRSSLTLGSNGLFYGTAQAGGANNFGTIFSFNPNGNVLTGLADFNGTNGIAPIDSLTLGNDGLFYGTASVGGASNLGTIFSFNPNGNVLTGLADFNGSNGSDPFSGLTLGSDGLFYGTTFSGGANHNGTIFSFNPSGNVLTGLANFNQTNSANSVASLTLGSDGLFYGTTLNGGDNGNGTIFSFNPSDNVLTSLADFNGTNGADPSALILGSNGLFYGTAQAGGANNFGTIFSFNPNGNVLTGLADFNGTNGSYPFSGLTLGSDGLFYGTTLFGGTNNQGTIFSFNLSGNVLTGLANFNQTNGANPTASLILAHNGLFYGTTLAGGPYGLGNGFGTIFSFTSVPEPSSLLGLIVVGAGALALKKRK